MSDILAEDKAFRIILRKEVSCHTKPEQNTIKMAGMVHMVTFRV